MSESAWLPEERRHEALPRLEELPLAESGYDRDAVRAAFDAFYRHAAELDSTLRTLEAVEAFQRQAGELRADIRALRAASWGPLPAMRAEPWYAGYGRRRAATGPEVAVADALPRVVVETAFIIAVAVGAAIAELSTPVVVGVIAAALLVVAAIEVVASFAEPRRARRARVVPSAPDAVEPEGTVAEPVVEEAAPQPLEDEPRVVHGPAAAHVRVLTEDERAAAPPERPVDDTQADVALAPDAPLAAEQEPLALDTERESVALDAEPEPIPAEPEEAWVEQPERAPEPVAASEPELVTPGDPEPAAASEPAADPWERGPELVPVPPESDVDDDTPPPSRLRFWRRRPAQEQEPPAFARPSGHVEVIEVRPATSPSDEPPATDEPVTGEAEGGGPPPVPAYTAGGAPPERAGLRRGRR